MLGLACLRVKASPTLASTRVPPSSGQLRYAPTKRKGQFRLTNSLLHDSSVLR